MAIFEDIAGLFGLKTLVAPSKPRTEAGARIASIVKKHESYRAEAERMEAARVESDRVEAERAESERAADKKVRASYIYGRR